MPEQNEVENKTRAQELKERSEEITAKQREGFSQGNGPMKFAEAVRNIIKLNEDLSKELSKDNVFGRDLATGDGAARRYVTAMKNFEKISESIPKNATEEYKANAKKAGEIVSGFKKDDEMSQMGTYNLSNENEFWTKYGALDEDGKKAAREKVKSKLSKYDGEMMELKSQAEKCWENSVPSLRKYRERIESEERKLANLPEKDGASDEKKKIEDSIRVREGRMGVKKCEEILHHCKELKKETPDAQRSLKKEAQEKVNSAEQALNEAKSKYREENTLLKRSEVRVKDAIKSIQESVSNVYQSIQESVSNAYQTIMGWRQEDSVFQAVPQPAPQVEAKEEEERKQAEKARQEQAEKVRQEQEEKARQEQEEKARQEQAEKARQEQEEKARQEQADNQKLEDLIKIMEEDERIRQEQEEKARQEQAEKARQEQADNQKLEDLMKITEEDQRRANESSSYRVGVRSGW